MSGAQELREPCPQGACDPVRAQEGSAAGSAGTDPGLKTVWGWGGVRGWEQERESLCHQPAGRTAGALAPPPVCSLAVWLRRPGPGEATASFSAPSGLLPRGPHTLQPGCLRVPALQHISEAHLETPSPPSGATARPHRLPRPSVCKRQ